VGRNNYGGDQGESSKLGNHDPRNGEIWLRALDGGLEIVGLFERNEMLLANIVNLLDNGRKKSWKAKKKCITGKI
jgi:hypothetical protein